MKRTTVLALAAIGIAVSGCASQQPGRVVLDQPDPNFRPDYTWRQFHQTDPRFNYGMRDGG